MKNIFFLVVIVSIFQACSTEPGGLKTPQAIDDTLLVLATKNNVPADNYSYAEISVVIKKRPIITDQVVLTTDKGSFANGNTTYTVNVSSNDTVKAYLKYNKAEVARVTASLFGRDTKEVFINFLPAYPSQILISPDSVALPAAFTSKTTITSKLTRQQGLPTEGLLISYYDSAAVTGLRSVGAFFNNTYSNAQGVSTVEYKLQDTSYHGFVYIKGYLNSDTGKVIASNRVFIR